MALLVADHHRDAAPPPVARTRHRARAGAHRRLDSAKVQVLVIPEVDRMSILTKSLDKIGREPKLEINAIGLNMHSRDIDGCLNRKPEVHDIRNRLQHGAPDAVRSRAAYSQIWDLVAKDEGRSHHAAESRAGHVCAEAVWTDIVFTQDVIERYPCVSPQHAGAFTIRARERYGVAVFVESRDVAGVSESCRDA